MEKKTRITALLFNKKNLLQAMTDSLPDLPETAQSRIKGTPFCPLCKIMQKTKKPNFGLAFVT